MEGWMDENFIKNVFQTVLAENVQVKVIRDRNSGYVFHIHTDIFLLGPSYLDPGSVRSSSLGYRFVTLFP